MDKAKAESEVEIMNERKVCLITGGGKALLKDGNPERSVMELLMRLHRKAIIWSLPDAMSRSWKMQKKNWNLYTTLKFYLFRLMSTAEMPMKIR